MRWRILSSLGYKYIRFVVRT